MNVIMHAARLRRHTPERANDGNVLAAMTSPGGLDYMAAASNTFVAPGNIILQVRAVRCAVMITLLRASSSTPGMQTRPDVPCVV